MKLKRKINSKTRKMIMVWRQKNWSKWGTKQRTKKTVREPERQIVKRGEYRHSTCWWNWQRMAFHVLPVATGTMPSKAPTALKQPLISNETSE